MMEYKGYLGRVVDFRGGTIDEVRQAFRDSVDFYLEGCRKDGQEPEKPFSGKFVVRLSPRTHRRAATLARIRDRSLNVVVVEALEEYLSAQGV